MQSRQSKKSWRGLQLCGGVSVGETIGRKQSDHGVDYRTQNGRVPGRQVSNGCSPWLQQPSGIDQTAFGFCPESDFRNSSVMTLTRARLRAQFQRWFPSGIKSELSEGLDPKLRLPPQDERGIDSAPVIGLC